MFKNEGRGLIRLNKAETEKGKWQPVIGTYKPLYDAVESNDATKLNKIEPIHEDIGK